MCEDRPGFFLGGFEKSSSAKETRHKGFLETRKEILGQNSSMTLYLFSNYYVIRPISPQKLRSMSKNSRKIPKNSMSGQSVDCYWPKNHWKNRWDRPLNTMHVMLSFSFSSLLYARWYWWSRIPKVNLTYLKSKGSYGKCTPLLRKIAVNPFVSHVFHEDTRATLDAIWFMAILCNRGVQFFSYQGIFTMYALTDWTNHRFKLYSYYIFIK